MQYEAHLLFPLYGLTMTNRDYPQLRNCQDNIGVGFLFPDLDKAIREAKSAGQVASRIHRKPKNYQRSSNGKRKKNWSMQNKKVFKKKNN